MNRQRTPNTGQSEALTPVDRSVLPVLNVQSMWKAVEATRSPLIVTDSLTKDDPIIYCNQAFVGLTGYDKAEILGRNCRFLQHPDTNPASIQAMREALGRHEHIRLQVENVRKNGERFWNDLVMSPVFDDGGKLINYIGLQLDITERIKFQQDLERSQHELERSNKELEQFTYAASHDLQEPLRMVSSYLQLIEERYRDKLDDDGMAFMDFATDGAKRMQSLVNDLLTLSRVRTSARSFKPVSLKSLLEESQFNLQTAIHESGAVIDHGRLPTLPVDRTQMIQLFQNLIGNAIKYRSPDRPPKIKVSARKDGNRYVVGVTDNGIGIEPSYHARIFGVFQRLHTRNEYPGTGVGLAICSKIVERHGGDIWVESAPNQGSTFYFTLPVKRTANTGEHDDQRGEQQPGNNRNSAGRG